VLVPLVPLLRVAEVCKKPGAGLRTVRSSKRCRMQIRAKVRASRALAAALGAVAVAVSVANARPVAHSDQLPAVARSFTIEDFPAEFTIMSQVRASRLHRPCDCCWRKCPR
jgi:hypothetical protein